MSIPTYKRNSNLLDLTPLLDVMFLLLIFFMLTMPSETSKALPVTLPSAMGEKELIDQQTLSLTVTSSGLLFLDDKTFKLDEIEKELVSRKKTFTSILIRGDHKSQLGILVKVWSKCQSAGFTNIKIAVSQAQ